MASAARSPTRLAREGALVAVGDLDAASAESVASELGGQALGLSLDVTDHAGFTAFLDEVESKLGPLDILVNNAGIMPVTPLLEESAESVARQLEINLHAVIHGTQEAMRRMVPRRTGHIVQLASIAGRNGCRTWRPTLRPSTASSGSRRPCAPSCAAPASRSPL